MRLRLGVGSSTSLDESGWSDIVVDMGVKTLGDLHGKLSPIHRQNTRVIEAQMSLPCCSG